MNNSHSIRRTAVAGQFYDANPSRLRDEINSYIEEAEKKTNLISGKKCPIAIIAAHAAYVYSGKNAASAFATLKNGKYKRAILIAPSHRYRLNGLAYGDFDFFETPLSLIKTDKSAIAKIANNCEFVSKAEKAHIGEHSLEVELPFLQMVQADIPIVPLICGYVNDEIVEKISDAMLDFLGDDNIWIISSDFTHYGQAFGYSPFEGDVATKIKKLDMGAAEKIKSIDYNGFRDYLDETGATICGANPIKIFLRTAQKSINRGAKIAGNLVAYANSAETSGDYSHCVSYASLVFYNS